VLHILSWQNIDLELEFEMADKSRRARLLKRIKLKLMEIKGKYG